MSQEIIYTSAPQGLKPGSRGFCTVVSTNGMARNLAERLEGLSGYRHRFEPHDPNAHLNPVNYSHLLLTVGGTKFHVLSQVRDAGLDYTQRSNKLAHHVAFADSEITVTPGSSPAWTMKADGFCEQTWDGETKTVAAGRKKLPAEGYRPAPCGVWEAVTGDAGWAAVLAESAKAQKPMHVLFPPGTDTLSLVVEALHLLPPEKRWTVTFSTYFTKLPAGTQCQWRFILDGTPEAIAVRRDPHNLTIDLCANLGPAPDSELATAARTGKPAYTLAPPPKLQPRRPTLPPAATSSPARAAEPDEVSSASYDLSSSTTAPPQRAPLPRIEPLRTSKLPWILVGCLALLLFIAVVVIGAFAIKDYGGLAAAPDTRDPTVAQNSPNPKEQLDRTATQSVEEERSQNSTHDNSEDPVDPPTSKPTDDGSHGDDETESTDEPPPEPEEQHAPLYDVIEVRQRNLNLPVLNPEKPEERSARLATIFVENSQDVELELVGAEKLLDQGIEYRFEPQDDRRSGARRWPVVKVATTIGQERTIGTFVLENQELSFEWERNADSSRLPYCQLRIKAANGTSEQDLEAVCSLITPTYRNPISLRFTQYQYAEALETEHRLPSPEDLQLEIAVRGLPEEEWELSATTLKPRHSNIPGEAVTLEIRDPFAPTDSLLYVQLSLVVDEKGHARLSVENQARPIMIIAQRAQSLVLPSGRDIELPGALEIKRPDSPIEFARARFEEVEEQTEQFLGRGPIVLEENIPTRERQIRGEIAALNRQLRLEREREQKNPDAISQLQDVIDKMEDLLRQAAGLKQQYGAAIEHARKQEEWQNKLDEFYQRLESSLQIDFELFIDIGDDETGEHRVPILQSIDTSEEQATSSPDYRNPFPSTGASE